MIKKSLLVGLFLSSVLAGSAFCQEYMLISLSSPVVQDDDCDLESASANAASQSPMTLDRSGMDKASVHLQILQQTTAHFSDSIQEKKPINDHKKLQIKPPSNS